MRRDWNLVALQGELIPNRSESYWSLLEWVCRQRWNNNLASMYQDCPSQGQFLSGKQSYISCLVSPSYRCEDVVLVLQHPRPLRTISKFKNSPQGNNTRPRAGGSLTRLSLCDAHSQNIFNYYFGCEPTQATQVWSNTTNKDKRIVSGDNYSAFVSSAPTLVADSTESSSFLKFTKKMVIWIRLGMDLRARYFSFWSIVHLLTIIYPETVFLSLLIYNIMEASYAIKYPRVSPPTAAERRQATVASTPQKRPFKILSPNVCDHYVMLHLRLIIHTLSRVVHKRKNPSHFHPKRHFHERYPPPLQRPTVNLPMRHPRWIHHRGS